MKMDSRAFVASGTSPGTDKPREEDSYHTYHIIENDLSKEARQIQFNTLYYSVLLCIALY